MLPLARVLTNRSLLKVSQVHDPNSEPQGESMATSIFKTHNCRIKYRVLCAIAELSHSTTNKQARPNAGVNEDGKSPTPPLEMDTYPAILEGVQP
jgi:hypothetical protein